MPKKGRDEIPSVNNVSNRDIVQRLNFLYQAGTYLNTLASIPTGTSSEVQGLRKRRRKRCPPTSIHDLGKTYIDTMKIVGQKATAKMDPAVKRSICKGCSAVLIPGATMSIRVKKTRSHRHRISYLCISCRALRSIPASASSDLDHASKDGVSPGTRGERPSDETPAGYVPPASSPEG
ncbi:RNAse P Rpr2/Rpp21/SNM1 subunit domain-containing protein [Infundibulicybe gibba]|nr:RNAse P Rpr2/Rpp21/SNM1 subunit domain-containing protein [Infundibulicybe gibba]